MQDYFLKYMMKKLVNNNHCHKNLNSYKCAVENLILNKLPILDLHFTSVYW